MVILKICFLINFPFWWSVHLCEWVLKSPTIIVLLSISPFMSVSVCLGEGNDKPLQYSCLENPVDRGVWWAAVYGVAQSRTRLKRLSMMDALEKELATHSSILAWRTPGTVEPGGLLSIGSHTTEETQQQQQGGVSQACLMRIKIIWDAYVRKESKSPVDLESLRSGPGNSRWFFGKYWGL